MTSFPAYEKLPDLDWPLFWAWLPRLEEARPGCGIVYLWLRARQDPAKALVGYSAGLAVGLSRAGFFARLETLSELGFAEYDRSASGQRFGRALPPPPFPALPEVPPPPGRRVKQLRGPGSAAPPAPAPVPVEPVITRRGVGLPSERPVWTRWRLKLRSAATWTPDDFLGFWVCTYRELYGAEDAEFEGTIAEMEGRRRSVATYLTRYLEGNRDALRDYLTFVFDKVRSGDVGRDRPLGFYSVINFKKQGFLNAYRARGGPSAGRRGADQHASTAAAWDGLLDREAS